LSVHSVQEAALVNDILVVVAQIVGLIVVGALLKWAQILKSEHAALLNSLVMNLTLPATVFVAVSQIQGENWQELLLVTLAAYGVIGVCGLVAYLATRLLRLERRTAGAFIITAMFGSTAFLGYPLVRGLFGEQSTEFGGAVFYSELGTLLPILTVAVIIASYYGEGARFGWRNLLAVLKSGPFVALLIGLLFYGDPVPDILLGMLKLLQAATVPLIMLSLGITIRWGDFFGRHARAILALNIIKLLIAPALAVGLCMLLGLTGGLRSVTILMSALPALMLCLSYANQYRLDIEFASNALFASFFFGAITLPIVASLITK
jgi:predicted permease